MNKPQAYFISFRTYGSWLRGDERGWEDKRNNSYGTPHGQPDAGLAVRDAERLKHPAVVLNDEARLVVTRTIREVCAVRGWHLSAVNVLAQHAHTVVGADAPPETVLSTLKAWATRRLREAGLFDRETTVWSGHGSTRWLWTEEQVARACEYVLNEQDRCGVGGDGCAGAKKARR